jgi:hypothetical protein
LKNMSADAGDGVKTGARGFKGEAGVGERAVEGLKGLAEALSRERAPIFAWAMMGLKWE